VFKSVISGLQQTYPREKMEEISTSFCFICLLHLANEQGLNLRSSSDRSLETSEGDNLDEDEDIANQKVGNIWDLKVRKPLTNHCGGSLTFDFG
jgi:condensin complex subunit 2